MCLIAVKPCGIKLPKDEYLKTAERKNSDGMGIAYWKHGTLEVKIKKDFINIKELLDYIHSNITEEDALVIHFRLATHGLKDIGNRHPFPISKDGNLLRAPFLICDSAVAHNGVIREYGIHATYSDTQKFIMDILSSDIIKNNLENPTIQKLVNHFIDGDRLAILQKDGFIWTFGEYVEEDGILYSNSGYKPFLNLSHSSYWNNHNYYDDEYGYDNRSFMEECEECKKRKWVMFSEIKIDETTSRYLRLCKGCRKKLRKENRKTKKDEVEKIQCDICTLFYEENKVDLIDEVHICKGCQNIYRDTIPAKAF